jgi:putative flippase GtrA
MVRGFLDRLYRTKLVAELLKFGIVGAFDTVLHFGLFNLLHYRLGWEPLIANGLAIIVAVTSSYLLNRYWTFSHRARSGVGREFTIFVVLNGIGWLISQACLGVARYLLDLTDPLALNAALVVGVGIGAFFRFTTYKRFVFLSPERAAARHARRSGRAEPEHAPRPAGPAAEPSTARADQP